jgi:beta-phosphoglucomutase-like phosphatase (HAD superfamily)
LVFEDSFAGIEAAKNAGIKVIAVASTHTAEKLKGDHMIIQDFRDLSLEVVSKLMHR